MARVVLERGAERAGTDVDMLGEPSAAGAPGAEAAAREAMARALDRHHEEKGKRRPGAMGRFPEDVLAVGEMLARDGGSEESVAEAATLFSSLREMGFPAVVAAGAMALHRVSPGRDHAHGALIDTCTRCQGAG